MSIHLSVPLDVSLCRRLLRDFSNQDLAKNILEEIEFYLNESRLLYFDEKLKLTADFVINGSDFPIPLTIKIHEPKYKPISDGPDFQKAWK